MKNNVIYTVDVFFLYTNLLNSPNKSSPSKYFSLLRSLTVRSFYIPNKEIGHVIEKVQLEILDQVCETSFYSKHRGNISSRFSVNPEVFVMQMD